MNFNKILLLAGPLPASLAGSGEANIVVTADGIAANPVKVAETCLCQFRDGFDVVDSSRLSLKTG
jgi:hypothetical protein